MSGCSAPTMYSHSTKNAAATAADVSGCLTAFEIFPVHDYPSSPQKLDLAVFIDKCMEGNGYHITKKNVNNRYEITGSLIVTEDNLSIKYVGSVVYSYENRTTETEILLENGEGNFRFENALGKKCSGIFTPLDTSVPKPSLDSINAHKSVNAFNMHGNLSCSDGEVGSWRVVGDAKQRYGVGIIGNKTISINFGPSLSNYGTR
jgi:hypothetical protein